MFLPSQEKALGILQCLETIEKTGEMPTGSELPFCRNAHKWCPRELLYNLSEFMDVEEPNFFPEKVEQNDLLAEETLRDAINTSDWAAEAYTVLLEYANEIPEPKDHYTVSKKRKNIEVLKINSPKGGKTKRPRQIDPKKFHLWVWEGCSVLLAPMEAVLADRENKVIEYVMSKHHASPQELKAIVVCDTKSLSDNQEGTKPAKSLTTKSKLRELYEDMWYYVPENYCLKGLSWLTRNYMGVENILETLEYIRGENLQMLKTKPITIIENK